MSEAFPLIYILHCTSCGVHGEIEEYTQTFVCPTCGGEMRLSEIRIAENATNVEQKLDQLVIARENGDISAGKQLAFLADNSDRNIREMVDNAFYKRQCKKNGVPFISSQPSTTPTFSDNDNSEEELESDATDLSKIQTYVNAGDSDLFKRALAIIVTEQKASTSYLQRRLTIGYMQAAKIIDELEKRGIIGPYVSETSQRKILISTNFMCQNAMDQTRYNDPLCSTSDLCTPEPKTVQLPAMKNRPHSCSRTHCLKCGIPLSFDHDLSGQQFLCPACNHRQAFPGGTPKLYNSYVSEIISANKTGYWARKKQGGPVAQHPAEIIQYLENAIRFKSIIISLSVTGICCGCGCLSAGYGMLANNSNSGQGIGIIWMLVAISLSFTVWKFLSFNLYRNVAHLFSYEPGCHLHHIHQPLIQILRTGNLVNFIDKSGATRSCTVSEKKYSDMKKNNVEAVFRLSHGIQILVFPDLILLKSKGRIRFLGSKEVNISIGEKISYTAKVTDYIYRWLHQRKDGGPDRRYNYNPQQAIPAEYGLDAHSTYEVHLQVDKCSFICEVNDTTAAQRIINIWNKKTA